MEKWLWTQEIPHQYAVPCLRDLPNYTEYLMGEYIFFISIFFSGLLVISVQFSFQYYNILSIQIKNVNFVTPKWYTRLIIIHFTDNRYRQCNKVLIFTVLALLKCWPFWTTLQCCVQNVLKSFDILYLIPISECVRNVLLLFLHFLQCIAHASFLFLIIANKVFAAYCLKFCIILVAIPYVCASLFRHQHSQRGQEGHAYFSSFAGGTGWVGGVCAVQRCLWSVHNFQLSPYPQMVYRLLCHNTYMI